MAVTEVPSIEKDQLIAAIEHMKRSMPTMIEYHKLDAKVRREHFLALVAEGFNEQQALELTKSL